MTTMGAKTVIVVDDDPDVVDAYLALRDRFAEIATRHGDPDHAPAT